MLPLVKRFTKECREIIVAPKKQATKKKTKSKPRKKPQPAASDWDDADEWEDYDDAGLDDYDAGPAIKPAKSKGKKKKRKKTSPIIIDMMPAFVMFGVSVLFIVATALAGTSGVSEEIVM